MLNVSRRNKQTEAGFSLLESLVAFTVLTMILVASFQIFGSGTQNLTHATRTSQSADKLQQALALLEAGRPREELDKDITVELRPIQSEATTWTTLLPYHAVLTYTDGKAESHLEAVVMRDQVAQP
jgi:Tfp pilus assembly protein PilV